MSSSRFRLLVDVTKGPSELPDIAVIIPHYDDVLRLRRCLNVLIPQIDDGVEVVVVDNSGADDFGSAIEDYPEVTFAFEPQRGAGAARNRGVAASTAPILAFTDCDCLPKPDWIKHARSCGELGGITGGAVELFDENSGLRQGAQVFEAIFAFRNDVYVLKEGFSVTANLITTRDVFQKVGPFGTELSEDKDWCHRARKTGVSISFNPELVVSHPSRDTIADLVSKWQRLTSESFALLPRRRLSRIFWAARAVSVLLSVVRDTPTIFTSAEPNGFSERMRCVVTLCRIRCLRFLWMLNQAISPTKAAIQERSRS